MQALGEINANEISINKAADKYGIPRTTLKDKLAGRTPLISTQGPNPYLTKEEEGEIVTWAVHMSRIGYGRTKEQIFDIVQTLLTKHPRPNPFVNNRPGREWWNGFLKRNPSLSLRVAENLSKARAVSCSKEVIMDWFQDFQTYITNEENCPEVLSNPAQLFNADEAGFPLSPK